MFNIYMDLSRKPVISFIIISVILLVVYIIVFLQKTNVFPISESFCWISSTIIALIIVNSIYEVNKFYNNENIIYTIIIYLLLIGCFLCSVGLVWNASVIPEIKLNLTT